MTGDLRSRVREASHIMRFVRFETSGTTHFGTTDGTHVRPFAPEIASLQAYLALAPDERAVIPTGDAIALDAVTLLTPIVPHKNVFCVGRNYLAHAEEGARAAGVELKLPSVPTFFTKAPTAVANPGATLHLDGTITKEYDYEAELAIVIGSRVRNVSEEDALDAIFGYTCLNDVTARDLQRAHVQWFKGKSLDDTCPIGPWVVTADEVGDAQSLDIKLILNGVTKQDSNTRFMIFDIKKIIASLSRGMTLEPGDIIATGTPDGVGFARTPPEFFADGDVVEVEIANVGTLRNTIAIAHATDKDVLTIA
jgi:2-keto-4-pentenoate hydratase/2-oxohepta-3-ene-1,7-dioic acid hydratase in catechol pathway